MKRVTVFGNVGEYKSTLNSEKQFSEYSSIPEFCQLICAGLSLSWTRK